MLSEDLCAFLAEQGVRSAYLHSEVKPMQRLELLQLLRRGDVDVIVGVNLLREVGFGYDREIFLRVCVRRLWFDNPDLAKGQATLALAS